MNLKWKGASRGNGLTPAKQLPLQVLYHVAWLLNKSGYALNYRCRACPIQQSGHTPPEFGKAEAPSIRNKTRNTIKRNHHENENKEGGGGQTRKQDEGQMESITD